MEEHDAAARKGDVEKCEKLRRKLSDQSARDFNWRIPETQTGSGLYNWEVIPVALLMDLRRRLDTIIDRLPEKKEPRA